MGKRIFTPDDLAKAQASRRARPSRKERMAAYAETFAQMRAKFPKWALPIIAQAEQGSLPAKVKLMCLDCVC
jgi:hypothetical protein